MSPDLEAKDVQRGDEDLKKKEREELKRRLDERIVDMTRLHNAAGRYKYALQTWRAANPQIIDSAPDDDPNVAAARDEFGDALSHAIAHGFGAFFEKFLEQLNKHTNQA